jgi:hypothetical protein
VRPGIIHEGERKYHLHNDTPQVEVKAPVFYEI